MGGSAIWEKFPNNPVEEIWASLMEKCGKYAKQIELISRGPGHIFLRLEVYAIKEFDDRKHKDSVMLQLWWLEG